jgi:hypothetical protein
LLNGNFFPGLEPDDPILANFQLNAALLPAETAVRFDQLFCRIP